MKAITASRFPMKLESLVEYVGAKDPSDPYLKRVKKLIRESIDLSEEISEGILDQRYENEAIEKVLDGLFQPVNNLSQYLEKLGEFKKEFSPELLDQTFITWVDGKLNEIDKKPARSLEDEEDLFEGDSFLNLSEEITEALNSEDSEVEDKVSNILTSMLDGEPIEDHAENPVFKQDLIDTLKLEELRSGSLPDQDEDEGEKLNTLIQVLKLIKENPGKKGIILKDYYERRFTIERIKERLSQRPEGSGVLPFKRKSEIIRDLIKVADTLDQSGLHKEANLVDYILNKINN